MPAQLSKNTVRRVKKASKLLNIEESVLLERAVKHFVSSLEEELEFKREMEAWDRISDEDWLKFEEKYLSGKLVI